MVQAILFWAQIVHFLKKVCGYFPTVFELALRGHNLSRVAIWSAGAMVLLL